jgi:nitrogen fixation protein NifQ
VTYAPDQASAHKVAHACVHRQQVLLAGAVDASSPDAILFATLIAARDSRHELALLGLSRHELDALFTRHFPRCRELVDSTHMAVVVIENHTHADFVAALRALLLDYVSAAVQHEDAECLASIIAHACLRPDHLWRDLGLDGRDAVSDMLERYFPTLAARSVANLRWKKFFAQELARRLGIEPEPAPGCPGCEDYAFCFPVPRN